MQVVRDLHPVPPFHTHPVVYAVPSVHTGRESTTFSAITDAMQDYGTRTFPHRGSRVTLGIARTLLRDKKGSRLPFWGAFALEDLPKGAFLGFYSGTFYDEGEVEEGLVSVPSSHYSINASGFTVVPPSPVTPDRYPMAMLNEPPDGVVASVALVEWTKRKQIDPSSPKSNEIVYNVAMHTSHAVAKGEELYFHYGKKYSRKHYPRGTKVGTPASLAKSAVPPDEIPSSYLAKHGILLPTDAYG